MPGPSQYVAPVESDPFRFTVDGLPPLRLVKHYSGLRLAEDATGLLIGPTDTRLPGAGIWVDNLRGTTYNPPCPSAVPPPGERATRSPSLPLSDTYSTTCSARADPLVPAAVAPTLMHGRSARLMTYLT